MVLISHSEAGIEPFRGDRKLQNEIVISLLELLVSQLQYKSYAKDGEKESFYREKMKKMKMLGFDM